MAAFKRMLQVGIKAENCLMRYRALKAHSTSSSSSSKEFSEKKMPSHPAHEAADFRDDFARRMDALHERMKANLAEHVAAIHKIRRDTEDFYKKSYEAEKKDIEKLGIGAGTATVVVATLSFIAGSSKEEV